MLKYIVSDDNYDTVLTDFKSDTNHLISTVYNISSILVALTPPNPSTCTHCTGVEQLARLNTA